MRKTVLLLVSLTFTFLLASGVALAYGGGGGGTTYNSIRCDGGKCQGTPKADEMLGTIQRDVIYGLKGDDRMWGRGPEETRSTASTAMIGPREGTA